ncbi:unnamed protein product [Leptosia nina]|uniref:UDP-glucuronosyltransferase n=1 Tax=Leptosia nina TaxID=320188 RepID=A0AAV1JGP4_9NEOP
MTSSLVFILCVITGIHSARILAVFPTPSVSHQVVFRPLTLELAKRGHELTVITTDPLFRSQSPGNYTEIDVHDMSYELWKKKFVYDVKFGMKKSIYQQVETILTIMSDIMCLQVEHPEIQRIIKNREKYDLLLLEAWPRQNLMYSYLFKAPVIQISSLGALFGNDENNFGVPKHPFLYPMTISQKVYDLTFWDKIEEIRLRLWFNKIWDDEEPKELKILREKISKDLPNYDILSDNIDMLFINTHPMWINNQPLPPNVITIWGIHKNPERVLPKDLQTFLDSSKNGVIYLSFGTNVFSSLLPQEQIQIFVRVFSKLPYDILWKWETNELPNRAENIKIVKWLPQSDLLKHPKIKLFITQGGLQSTDEAIIAGVPMIGVPMLGDQWSNVEKCEFYKIGKKVEMETITEEELEGAIQTVINDTSYRDNIIRLRKLMNDQPQGALERAVWWTEYVLRHGGAKHLRAAGANMHWTKYYEIEFVLQLFSIVFVALVASLLVIYFVWKQLSIPKSKLKDN